MRVTKILFLFVFCGMSLRGFAQKPGFMGKRFSAGGEFSYGYLGVINFHYGGYVDYVVGRKFQIGINYFMYKAKPSIYADGMPGRIHGYTAMLNLRFYRTRNRGAMAPIGKYFDFAVSYSGDKYKYQSDVPISAMNQLIHDGTFIQFHFAGGIQTVVFNCITADCGVRIGFPPIALGSKDLSMEILYMNGLNFYTRIGYIFGSAK